MKRINFKLIVMFAGVLLVPYLASAQVGTFKDVATVFIALVKGVINILFVSLPVGIAYGVAMYFINSDDVQKREQIKGYLLWAVIGVAVTFGMWGFIWMFCDTLAWCTAGIPYIQPPS